MQARSNETERNGLVVLLPAWSSEVQVREYLHTDMPWLEIHSNVIYCALLSYRTLHRTLIKTNATEDATTTNALPPTTNHRDGLLCQFVFVNVTVNPKIKINLSFSWKYHLQYKFIDNFIN